VLAGLQGVDGDPRVKMVGYGYGHGIDIRLVEQVVIIRVGPRNFEPIGGFLEPLGIDFSNCHR